MWNKHFASTVSSLQSFCFSFQNVKGIPAPPCGFMSSWEIFCEDQGKLPSNPLASPIWMTLPVKTMLLSTLVMSPSSGVRSGVPVCPLPIYFKFSVEGLSTRSPCLHSVNTCLKYTEDLKSGDTSLVGVFCIRKRTLDQKKIAVTSTVKQRKTYFLSWCIENLASATTGEVLKFYFAATNVISFVFPAQHFINLLRQIKVAVILIFSLIPH